MAIEAPFAVQVGAAGVPQNSRETLVNMYAEQGAGASPLVRRQRPGLRSVETISGVKRGMAKFSHGHYLVARKTLYSYVSGTLTAIADLDTSAGNVTIISDDNGNVAVSDGATLYHWDGATFSKPTTPSAVGTLDFIGGFGIYNEPGSGRFYVSALNDLTSWNALDFATAESNSDAIVRVFVQQNEAIFFGPESVDFWRNTGNADFPLTFNTAMERGCVAPFSVAADDNTVFFLGNDLIFYRMDGYRPARVSTHAIEDKVSKLANASAAQAFIYTHRGHKFYTVRFPDEITLQYNIATGLWNEAKTYGRDDWYAVAGARPTDYVLTNAGLAALDASLYSDEGQVMERIAICAPVTNSGERFTVNALYLDAEVGRVQEGEAEPTVALQVSRNGETFGNERRRGLGETGDYSRRVVWRNLGQAREFVAKMTVTDNVAFNVMAMRSDVS